MESVWLALLGSATGVVVGLLFGAGFNALGILWQPPGTVEETALAVRLSLMVVLPPFGVSIIATLLSALFPAIQTSRLRVVDALRVD